MARRRFFVESVRNSHAVLEGDDARHLTRVLRVETGQRFELSDNQSVYLAEVEALGKDQVSFRVIERLPVVEPPVRIILLASLFKFDRFEWLLEKATELGVERIILVRAERSEKGLDQAALKRVERWRKIVRESSQQSRRAHLPVIADPIAFREALAYSSQYRFFLDETPDLRSLASSLPSGERLYSDTVSLLTGPEGGWTDEERAAASASGWTHVSLGPNILRAETAAIAALAVVGIGWL